MDPAFIYSTHLSFPRFLHLRLPSNTFCRLMILLTRTALVELPVEPFNCLLSPPLRNSTRFPPVCGVQTVSTTHGHVSSSKKSGHRMQHPHKPSQIRRPVLDSSSCLSFSPLARCTLHTYGTHFLLNVPLVNAGCEFLWLVFAH